MIATIDIECRLFHVKCPLLLIAMKPNDVKRAFRANRHDRAVGDAPSLGRVTRMGQKKRSKDLDLQQTERGSRRRRRGSRKAQGQNRVTMVWTAVMVGLGLLFLGGAIWLWFSPKRDGGGSTFGTEYMKIEPVITSNKDFASPSKEQALEIVRKAMASRTLQAVDSLFRKGASTDQEILRFLEKLETNSGHAERYDWLSNMDRDGLSVEGVLVGFEGKDKSSERMAFLTPNRDGKWQVDFDAFARTATPSWDAFLAQGADRAMVRVFVTQDSYFNGPFSEESQWICYGITSPDVEEMLHGYCRVGSKEAEDMELVFSNDRRASRATLALVRVKDAGPRQFEIAEVYAGDWILTHGSKQ
jgi:hypothetical protein